MRGVVKIQIERITQGRNASSQAKAAITSHSAMFWASSANRRIKTTACRRMKVSQDAPHFQRAP